MTTYKCRVTKPSVSQWFEAFADSPELATNEFHYQKLGLIPGVQFQPDASRPGLAITFACIEVEGYGEWISRVHTANIVRKGGVKRPGTPRTIQEVAMAIGWNGPPQELLESDWDGEDTSWQ